MALPQREGEAVIAKTLRPGRIALDLVALLILAFILAPSLVFAGKAALYSWQIGQVADRWALVIALRMEPAILQSLGWSLILAAIVAIGACLWGLTLAPFWLGWARRGQWSRIAISALPLLLPRFLLAGGLALSLVEISGGFGFTAVAFAQIFMAAPAAAAILAIGWSRLDRAQLRAARQAGAKRSEIFRRIILPYLRLYVAIAILAGFLLSIGDFYLGYILGGAEPLLSPTLFSGLSAARSPLYYPLALLVMIGQAALVLILANLWRRAGRDR